MLFIVHIVYLYAVHIKPAVEVCMTCIYFTHACRVRWLCMCNAMIIIYIIDIELESCK